MESNNVKTGIFKQPTEKPINLTKEGVANDAVMDTRYHGGSHKSCYLFGANHYDYWKELYPELDWDYGMFGENITVEHLDESKICIGDTYKISDATIRISEHREPCYKLGVKFGTQKVLKQFVKYGYCGTYVQVLEEGKVRSGDTLQLLEKSEVGLTVQQFFYYMMGKSATPEADLEKILANPAIKVSKREKLAES